MEIKNSDLAWYPCNDLILMFRSKEIAELELLMIQYQEWIRTGNDYINEAKSNFISNLMLKIDIPNSLEDVKFNIGIPSSLKYKFLYKLGNKKLSESYSRKYIDVECPL